MIRIRAIAEDEFTRESQDWIWHPEVDAAAIFEPGWLAARCFREAWAWAESLGMDRYWLETERIR